MKQLKRLNIFVDETGDFGCEENSSKLYGVSFTFHDQDNDINTELNISIFQKNKY